MGQKIAWRPNEGPQTNALIRSEFEILYGGARGGGKTECGLAWLLYPIKNPKYRFLVLRRNAKDLASWLDRARSFYAPIGGKIVGNPPEIIFPSGARGVIGHLKDANAFEHYLGAEYQRILIEELTLIKSEELYLKLISSCRSTVDGLGCQIFLTTNPGGAGHNWVKKRFVSNGNSATYIDPESGRSRIFIKSLLSDNPKLRTADPSYELYLKSLPEKLRRMWLDGDWDVMSGKFFDEFDRKIHTYKHFDPPKHWPKFRAIDWGFSDPLCCLWFAVGPENHLYVYREFYRNHLTDSEYAEKINAASIYGDGTKEEFEFTVGDPNSFWVKKPETGHARHETFALNGIGIIKADNNRKSGWGRVREYLQLRDGKSWLHISEKCINLIDSIESMMHSEDDPEDCAPSDLDHAADALRYGLHSRIPRNDLKESGKSIFKKIDWK